MEADVVLAAERAGVGQGRRGDQPLQLGPLGELLDHGADELLGGRLLHERDQRLDRAEGQPLRLLPGRDRAKSQVHGGRRAHRGDQHPPPHIRQKFPPVAAHAHRRLPSERRTPLDLIASTHWKGNRDPQSLWIGQHPAGKGIPDT